ncbi:MAG: NUDIX domain-containing protein [Bacteroidia bacterium]|nr:NUDIX domain-containing protein [Bacteroidia bacterium]
MTQQNYKIFINEHTLQITSDKQHIDNPESFIFIESKDFLATVKDLENSELSKPRRIALVCENPKLQFENFKQDYKVIRAGGGIVFNAKKELLLIKRLGKWDLPKGKMEKGEDIRLTALREVHEECGINFLGIVKKFGETYHTYETKGRKNLKRTNWYYMIAWDNNLVPQVKEDITEAVWVNEEFIRNPEIDTYESIRSILDKIKF